eukprot:IDg22798t1
MKLNGCVVSVRLSKPTGVNDRMATGLFNGVHMNNATDAPGKRFKYLGAWQIFRSHLNMFAIMLTKGRVLPKTTPMVTRGLLEGRF